MSQQGLVPGGFELHHSYLNSCISNLSFKSGLANVR